MDTENRFIDLESKLAFQEDTLQELNKIVYQQQMQLDKMQQSINQLNHRLKAESDASPANSDPADEVPPHY